MQIFGKAAAVVAGGTAAGLAAAANDLPAPVSTAIATFITMLGAALIRWFERKILKQQAAADADKIATLTQEAAYWKRQAQRPNDGLLS